MAQSWIVTSDPHVTFRFQTEYQEARSVIFPFEQLVYRTSFLASFLGLSPSAQRLLTPYDQRLYLKKLRETLFPNWQAPLEFEGAAKELFRSLKDKRISPPDFMKAVLRFPDHFLKLAKLYEAYSQKKEVFDEEDFLECAIQNLKNPSFKTHEKFPSQILVLAYRLSDLQKEFLEVLAKRVEIEQLSIAGLEKSTQVPSVLETQTPEQEVDLICAHLEKNLHAGISASSLFVFCTRLADYRQELESVLGRANIPFSFWNSSEENHERVSLLEWHPNTMVFPNMKRVFLCGAFSFPLSPSFLSDEEKGHLNQVFQTVVFKTQSDHKEETKNLLHGLETRCQKLWLTYAHRPAAVFEEFLKESPQISVTEYRSKKSSVLESQKKERSRILSFSSQNKTDFLPKIYSIRSLIQYQRCPHGFLLKECLNLHPEKKIGPELTTQEEGEWIHDILYRYFSKSLSLEEAMSESASILTGRFQKELLEPDRKRMTKLLKDFLEEEKVWRAKSRFTPRYFELAFGTRAQKPLELAWKGKVLFLRGKIDRVNVDEKAKEFEIIDYKTGSTVPSTKEVMEGKSFQLTLYAMAMEQFFLPGFTPSRGFFYRVKECDVKKGFLCETKEEWQILKEKTLSEVFSLVEKIKTFSFPATPQRCYAACELKNMCEQV
ncbi:MAG: PD-(D/E)XK nuclease family protein [Deltaproteobacteria bacterium]|nr:PD-(D/E)XK nuclease family protein [Deltaproteobacteria bacterium]